jgi:hypothetical protein
MAASSRPDGRRHPGAQPGRPSGQSSSHKAPHFAETAPAAGVLPQGDVATQAPLPLEQGRVSRQVVGGSSCPATYQEYGRSRRWRCQRPAGHLSYSRRHEVYKTGTAELVFGWEDPL